MAATQQKCITWIRAKEACIIVIVEKSRSKLSLFKFLTKTVMNDDTIFGAFRTVPLPWVSQIIIFSGKILELLFHYKKDLVWQINYLSFCGSSWGGI